MPAVSCGCKETNGKNGRMRPAGGAYRIRTGVNGLEGRCATAAPMLRITAGVVLRAANRDLPIRRWQSHRNVLETGGPSVRAVMRC